MRSYAMPIDTISRASAAALPERIPPLQNGDRLTQDEFLRRYETKPDVNHAQLIEGVVYMPSPVAHCDHACPHFDVIGWLGRYVVVTPRIKGGDNTTVMLDRDNVPQPDALLIVLPEYGGQVRISAAGYVVGGPELIVEVAASSTSIELHAKLAAYRPNGVREYVVWRVFEAVIDWFVLRGGQYELLQPGPDGFLRSEVLPGLWLDAGA
jgi:Uma2 family endonuclease